MTKASPLLLAALLGACVSLEPPPPRNIVINPDQKTIILLFASPGPWVSQGDTKAESAAKILPGLGLMMQGAQDERALKDSKDLERYMGGWLGGTDFHPVLVNALKKTGYPGRWIDITETGITTGALDRFNRASDVLRWRQRFFVPEPGSLRHLRNYSSMIELDGSLIFEVNIQYGVTGIGMEVHPTLTSVTRLYRASTLRLLWQHDGYAEDLGAKRNIYDFKIDPESLKTAVRNLMPALASQIAGSLRKEVIERSLVIQRRLDALSPGAVKPKKEATEDKEETKKEPDPTTTNTDRPGNAPGSE